MYNANVNPSEFVGLCDQLVGLNLVVGTYTTGWIAAKDFAHYMALITLGNTVGSGTLDAKLEQAQDASGTGAKDITGKDITALTNESPSVDKTAIINLRPDELDLEEAAGSEFTHFRLKLTVATATVLGGAMVLGVGPKYGPATEFDASDVVEVIG